MANRAFWFQFRPLPVRAVQNQIFGILYRTSTSLSVVNYVATVAGYNESDRTSRDLYTWHKKGFS
jgi:hypothetical protein